MSSEAQLVVLAAAGLVAGFVNAVAGAGSLLTLPALIFTGLDPLAANATNRLAVLAQAAAALRTFVQRDVKPPAGSGWIAAVTSGGAVLGAALASRMNNTTIRVAIVAAMLFFAGLSLVRRRPAPERRTPDTAGQKSRITAARTLVAFAALGVYAGFLQAGAGILMLLVLSRWAGVPLVKANAVKALVVLMLTLVAIAVFAMHRVQLDLLRGAVLGAASLTGAVMGARTAVKRGAPFIRGALIAAILASAIKLLADAL